MKIFLKVEYKKDLRNGLEKWIGEMDWKNNRIK
jgi:hypothetical protein